MYDGDIAVSNGCTAAYNLTTGEVIYSGKDTFITADGINASRTNGNLWEGDNAVAWGIYTDCFQGDMRNYGFNITTGELAWYTEPREYPYGTFNSYSNGAGDNRFYVESYDGHIYAYNATNGATLWAFSSGDAGLAKAFGTWPFWTAPASADGKVYASTGEHSQTNPRVEGDKLYCINDTDGTEIWSIAGMWGGKSIADDKLWAMNGADGLMYCFGRGPSAVTVPTLQSIASPGCPVLITGTVTDESPGQQGTAAVSDADMTAWMEYLHMQRPKPTNATFVEVTLTAIDSNGQVQNIGSAWSDEFGNYAISWTPTVAGTYTIKASFAGSISYFSSEAGTKMVVETATAASPGVTSSPGSTQTPGQTTSPTSSTSEQPLSPSPEITAAPNPNSEAPTTTYIIIGAVVIAIVVAAAALILKKRQT
jgi:outer membrane protein assembly factor BamB